MQIRAGIARSARAPADPFFFRLCAQQLHTGRQLQRQVYRHPARRRGFVVWPPLTVDRPTPIRRCCARQKISPDQQTGSIRGIRPFCSRAACFLRCERPQVPAECEEYSPKGALLEVTRFVIIPPRHANFHLDNSNYLDRRLSNVMVSSIHFRYGCRVAVPDFVLLLYGLLTDGCCYRRSQAAQSVPPTQNVAADAH